MRPVISLLFLQVVFLCMSGCAVEEHTSEVVQERAEESGLLFLGNPIQYAYDAAGKLVAVYDPNGNSAQYVYDAAGNIQSITQFANTALALFDFSPRYGAPGSSVTITGSGFSTTLANNVVKFNGTSASVAAATPQQILVTVPSGATTGTVSVTVSGTTKTSSITFTVGSRAPTITSFTPLLGNANTVVTITGTNYQTNLVDNAVSIGGEYANLTAATATQLTSIAQSTSGKMRITTPYGSVVSAQDFFQLPNGVTAAAVGFTGRVVPDGNAITASLPSASQTGLVLFDASANDSFGFAMYAVNTGGSGYGSVTLFDPAGNNVFASSVTNASAGYFQLPLLKTAGTYMLMLQPTNGATQLQATLLLSRTVTGSLSLDGTPTTFTATRAGQNAQFTFTPTAGSSVALTLSGSTYPGGDPQARVLDGSGNLIAGVGVPSGGGTATTDLLNLSAVPYVLNLYTNDGSTGQVTFRITSDATGSAGIVNGTAVTLNMNTYQHGRYTFAGTAGDFLGIGMPSVTTSPAGNVTYKLTDPSGAYVTSCTFAGAGSCSVGTLSASGTYALSIGPPDSVASVSVQLLLSKAQTGAVTIGGAPATFNTSRVGQAALYSFAATAGQSAIIDLSNCTFPSGISGVLYDPSGYFAASVSCATGSTATTTLSNLSAGTYSVRFVPNGSDTGSVTLNVH